MTERSILLVEDDAATARGVTDLLETSGHHVVWVPSVMAACFQMRPPTTPFDLVLLDLNLGEERGEDLVKYARKADIPLPPILIVSGGAPDYCAQVAGDMGAAGFLCKPHSALELMQAVDRAMGAA